MGGRLLRRLESKGPALQVWLYPWAFECLSVICSPSSDLSVLICTVKGLNSLKTVEAMWLRFQKNLPTCSDQLDESEPPAQPCRTLQQVLLHVPG